MEGQSPLTHNIHLSLTKQLTVKAEINISLSLVEGPRITETMLARHLVAHNFCNKQKTWRNPQNRPRVIR
jgi:hypothetical protein